MAASSIPLSFRPTVEAIDPQTLQQRALSLQQLAQGVAQQKVMAPLQVQAAQQENQQRQIQMDQMAATNRAYQDAMSVGPDGKASFDQDKLTKALATAGHGAAIPGILKATNEYQKSAADLAEANGKVAVAQTNFGGILGALSKAADYDPQFFLSKAQLALSQKAVDPAMAQQVMQAVQGALQQDPTGQTARGIVKQISDRLIAGSPEQQKLANETATANLHRAQTPGAEAESTIAQQKAGAMKAFLANPQAADQQIDTILPPQTNAQMNAAYKAEIRAAMAAGDMGRAQAAIAAASEHAARIDMATNPEVRKGEVQKAVETEKAVSPLKTAQAVATETATMPLQVQKAIAVEQATSPLKIQQAIAQARALRQGDNPAVANVAPAAVNQVQNQAVKLDEAFVKSASATEALGRILDLAESGNKAAGSNLPLVGVETLNALNGIKRINSSEISQYESAGNLLDQIKGKIGKLTVGKPIPQDVLDDIRELHQSLGQQAYSDYVGSLKSLNSRTGSQFQPNFEAPNIRKTGKAGTPVAPPLPAKLSQSDVGKTYTSAKDGKAYTITAVSPDGLQFKAKEAK